MKISVKREDLLKPLQTVSGVVERRQTLPVLSNILFQIKQGTATLTATDLEVELVANMAVEADSDGTFTVPARKLLDICKALPDSTEIHLEIGEEDRAKVRAGRSRFTLATLPVEDFPLVEDIKDETEVSIPQRDLKHLIDMTAFSMAQQDVRYYLNGLLMEFHPDRIRAVASDGHRLAICECPSEGGSNDGSRQVIVPRKGVMELGRLLESNQDLLSIKLGENHIRLATGEFQFTSKLVDGKYPDYQRVLPREVGHDVIADREDLRKALLRASILSNEKYRGVRLEVAPNRLKIEAQNPELEEAEEEIAVQYDGDEMTIGFNVTYLVDALGVIEEDSVKVSLSDPNSSCLIQGVGVDESRYVVMPMHL